MVMIVGHSIFSRTLIEPRAKFKIVMTINIKHMITTLRITFAKSISIRKKAVPLVEKSRDHLMVRLARYTILLSEKMTIYASL